MATLVACGWARAAKKAKLTDRPTDGPTGGQSGLLSRMHATKKGGKQVDSALPLDSH